MKNKKMLVKKPSKLLGFLKWIGVTIISLVILGFIYEQASEYYDSKTLKAPGQMVQVGVHKMHIYCTGQNVNGSPTVIFEAGGGNAYISWSRVQPEIAKSTKVCSYDRSGLGFSEGTNDDRTNLEVTKELETLLRNANIPGPYVLAGHSLGGYYVRVFAKRNINEIKGLVLIDPSVEEQATCIQNYKPSIAEKIAGITTEGAYKIGIARLAMTLFPNALGMDVNNLEIERAFYSTLFNNKNKKSDGDGMTIDIQEVESAKNFGNLPAVVLSADKSREQAIATCGEQVKDWHSNLSKKLSNNAKYILVKNSGHSIQDDQPQIVLDEILAMLKS